MTDAVKGKRRRWQFSLRTLLILVTLAVGLLVAWRVYTEPYRRQRETMALIEELGGTSKSEAGGPAWMRNAFGTRNFQDITFVDVGDCDDPHAYFQQIVSLPRLQTLVVGGRRFTDKQLAQLNRKESLRGLVLDSTGVTDDGVAALKRVLPCLVVHKSQRRAIAALRVHARDGDGHVGTERCEQFPRLRRIVGDEYFENAIEAAIEGCKTSQFSTHLACLIHLRELCLGWSPISDADLRHLKGLTQLQVLDLQSTKVTDAGLLHLKRLTKLQDLDLEHTGVTDASLIHLRGLTNLGGLGLKHTQVTGVGLVHLKRLPQLGRLWLQGTRIDDDTLNTHGSFKPSERGWASLKLLNLRGTRITDAGLQELAAALPNCAILPELSQ